MLNSENKYVNVMRKNSDIPDELINILVSDKPILFYGTGNQGLICEETLVDGLGFKVEAFLKSDEYKNVANRYSQLPSYCLSESPFDKNDVCIILAMGRKNSDLVYDALDKAGYSNLFLCEDWESVNAALREVRFQGLMDEHGIELDKTKDYIKIRDFRFNNPWKERDNYLSFFLGEFGELVAPHILHDLSALRTEGPYCYGQVDISPGDVVLDLGANIGLFTATASALKCKVYAFEPIDFISKYLKKTTDLYENIEIVKAAAGNKTGTVTFSKVAEDFHDIGESTIIDRQNEEAFEAIIVPAITIDDFVEKYNLDRVDFIKADIEGSERYMLEGAKKTLKELKPKMALCTYHFPDDKEVMTNLILNANPDYKIEYRWEKLYAYVP
ncbi:FkbM family methyltransferase [Butyrivibrio sp. INlla16]|uniref:FkbM family methyltransferase n=1 Tax=Butyrivibrio sp. INlla16 TaxID=1520807 RepID=UPI00088ED64D|nr:FkbM family methyltransferase [Butyrivibrio sp. INlla16]SDB60302.1 methyltransferase, FkbM family [Butyrivibrio sp. INlla16]